MKHSDVPKAQTSGLTSTWYRPLVLGSLAAVVVLVPLLALRTTWHSGAQRAEQPETLQYSRFLADQSLGAKLEPALQNLVDAHYQTGPPANETVWFQEPEDKDQAFTCLRDTFVNGTEHVEKHIYSQYGEDGIIEAIFKCIGHRSKYYVEFGAETGQECTTRNLRANGWTGLVMDGSHENAAINLRREFFTAENIVSHFQKYSVPLEFDLLTVDIDLNTFWVLHALLLHGYRPRAIVVEFNRNLPPWEAVTVEYKANEVWGWGRYDYNCYFGASIFAVHVLLQNFEYHMLAQDADAINAFAVRGVETGGRAPVAYAEVLAALPRRSQLCWGIHASCSGKAWVTFDEGLDLTRPRSDWDADLVREVLTQRQVARVDGKNVQIYTAHAVLTGADGVTARAADTTGRELDAGCLSDEDRAFEAAHRLAITPTTY